MVTFSVYIRALDIAAKRHSVLIRVTIKAKPTMGILWALKFNANAAGTP